MMIKISLIISLALLTACAHKNHEPHKNNELISSIPVKNHLEPPPLAPQTQAPIKSDVIITRAEFDALLKQIANCWSIQPGAAHYEKKLLIEVKLVVSRDRRVQSATIVDQSRYNRDPYFRAAADAAIRALNSPQCKTLQLNPDKYDMWKDMIVEFEPNAML